MVAITLAMLLPVPFVANGSEGEMFNNFDGMAVYLDEYFVWVPLYDDYGVYFGSIRLIPRGYDDIPSSGRAISGTVANWGTWWDPGFAVIGSGGVISFAHDIRFSRAISSAFTRIQIDGRDFSIAGSGALNTDRYQSSFQISPAAGTRIVFGISAGDRVSPAIIGLTGTYNATFL